MVHEQARASHPRAGCAQWTFAPFENNTRPMEFWRCVRVPELADSVVCST